MLRTGEERRVSVAHELFNRFPAGHGRFPKEPLRRRVAKPAREIDGAARALLSSPAQSVGEVPRRGGGGLPPERLAPSTASRSPSPAFVGGGKIKSNIWKRYVQAARAGVVFVVSMSVRSAGAGQRPLRLDWQFGL
jgi:hypothetical protein